ncbi:MAG TPA: hypothetical protein VFC39_15330 [Acidobacteriaceae bacterium]|nr:hypothetical protein [Acidobacteriaceae bacterium]
MNSHSTVSSNLRRTVLLMLAGASVALMLTGTMTKMQGAVAGIRNTYKPCVHAKMTGDWMCACVLPTAAKVCPKTGVTRRTL